MFADTEQRTKVKICGLTTLQDARFVAGAHADYMGFIFYEKSKRYIEAGQAGAIINWIEGPECVGVFVNQPMDDVNMIATQTGIDLVQLHGNESPEYCDLIDKPVIKAFHIDQDTTTDSLQKAINPYLNKVDYLLFDTKVENAWGGTGKSFDWKVLDNLPDEVPFFLSGGLSPENVRQACETVHPYAVDISSSLELEPGIKDYDKVEAFFESMDEIWEKQESGEF